VTINKMVLMLLVGAAQLRADPPRDILKNMALVVVQTYIAAAEIGAALWQKLDDVQAQKVLKNVGTQAQTLQQEKKQLRSDVVNNRIPDKNALEERIRRLSSQVVMMSGETQTFAYELDQAVSGIGAKLRDAMDDARREKAEELVRAAEHWPDRNAVAKDLDAAVGYLQLWQDTITCFNESIETKKPACNVKELKQKIAGFSPDK
jgi:hypothetical protein